MRSRLEKLHLEHAATASPQRWRAGAPCPGESNDHHYLLSSKAWKTPILIAAILIPDPKRLEQHLPILHPLTVNPKASGGGRQWTLRYKPFPTGTLQFPKSAGEGFKWFRV